MPIYSITNEYVFGVTYMAMKLSSVQGAAGITQDKQYYSEPAQQKEEPIRAMSVEELQKVEQRGNKLSIGEEQYVKNIERAIEAAKGPVTTLEVSVHEKTKEVMIKVRDKETGELIREVPPEKILDMVSKFMEMNGIIIDEKV